GSCPQATPAIYSRSSGTADGPVGPRQSLGRWEKEPDEVPAGDLATVLAAEARADGRAAETSGGHGVTLPVRPNRDVERRRRQQDRGENAHRPRRRVFGDSCSRGCGCPPFTEGKPTSISRPPPGCGLAVRVAWWAAAIACTIERPSPRPSLW